MATEADQAPLLRRRLVNDIREIIEKPYPGITVHIQDKNALVEACLILSPPEQQPLHLLIEFTDRYPLEAPRISIQSRVNHPNVFNNYICASILNTEEGYTPAYTLKGICIQLLSFFSSDKVEQMHGGGEIDRVEWQREVDRETQDLLASHPHLRLRSGYACWRCGFEESQANHATTLPSSMDMTEDVNMDEGMPPYAVPKPDAKVGLTDLPNEVLLLICDELDEQGLFLAAKAWNGFGRVMRQYNIIHVREMQCFTLKKGFNEATLGVGIHVEGKNIQSEFDLISLEAFSDLQVRRSVQGLIFEQWLPLPISQTHWEFRAKRHVYAALNEIGMSARLNGPPVTVLYSFLNDVVVRLSREASEDQSQMRRRSRFRYDSDDDEEPKSTLTHASEKAIESYFHLYHLLLCLAIDHPPIVEKANATIQTFIDGKRDKQHVPNLGHLLIMVLISDHDVTEDLIKAIIKEAVTRNVVWMLDAKGQGMAELSFLETDAASDYRLSKTFQAGKTSYRLLMFAKLMQRCVAAIASNRDPQSGANVRKTIAERCKDLFNSHGAPPYGAAASLAEQVRKIQAVDDFPSFLKVMGIQTIPRKDEFTKWLRSTMNDSVDKGYSKWALTQPEALVIRRRKEPNVGVPENVQPAYSVKARYTFFPEDRRNDIGYRGDRGVGRGRAGGRGGRGGR